MEPPITRHFESAYSVTILHNDAYIHCVIDTLTYLRATFMLICLIYIYQTYLTFVTCSISIISGYD